MAEAEGPLRLRDWLVAQIESGGYAGSRWEDAGMTVFRIRWKHAAKQGYQARQDAVIFRGPGHRTLHTPGAPCPSSSSVTLVRNLKALPSEQCAELERTQDWAGLASVSHP